MGVSTEIWRARIGGFLPVARRLSASQPRESSTAKRSFRTYKRPSKDSRTHHLSIIFLFCLLILSVVCLSRRGDPERILTHVGFDFAAMNALVLYMDKSHRNKQSSGQERLTICLRFVLFALLLLCGDVESNPGPNGKDSPVSIFVFHHWIRNHLMQIFVFFHLP